MQVIFLLANQGKQICEVHFLPFQEHGLYPEEFQVYTLNILVEHTHNVLEKQNLDNREHIHLDKSL